MYKIGTFQTNMGTHYLFGQRTKIGYIAYEVDPLGEKEEIKGPSGSPYFYDKESLEEFIQRAFSWTIGFQLKI